MRVLNNTTESSRITYDGFVSGSSLNFVDGYQSRTVSGKNGVATTSDSNSTVQCRIASGTTDWNTHE